MKKHNALVTKEACLPFGFNCWQSSRPSSENIMNTDSFLSSAMWISKSLLSHRWLPATQIFRLSNLIQIPFFKLLSTLHVHSWYSDLSFRLWVFYVIECLENFFCFSLSLRTSPFRKRSVSVFSVGLPQTVCPFVSLRNDNILQQYIGTFLKTASPNLIQTCSSCRFEKFRIKRNPNRPSFNYPLDLTK